MHYMKTCTRCRTSKPFDAFHCSRSARDGRQSRCKACQAATKVRKRAPLPPAPLGMKTCRRCRSVKPLEAFYRLKTEADGRQLWCRECHRTTFEAARRARGVRPAVQARAERRAYAMSPTRICIRCKREKFRTEFHRSAFTPSGYNNICRACRPAYDREASARVRADPIRLAAHRRMRATIAARRRRTLRNDPDRLRREAARQMVAAAVLGGYLMRQPCEVCGAARVDAHHDDYAKPLKVRWLCRAHHSALHKTTH